MKTFFEEYGLSVIIGCVICLLVVVASPVGGAINSNLKTTSTNMKDTGTAVEAKAGKSIKTLAGEEEPVPETVFVGYNSSNKTLYFSHDENSEGYSNCNYKYGDVSDKNMGTGPNARPYGGHIAEDIVIENKLKPKNMNNWFTMYYSTTATSSSCTMAVKRISGLSLIDTSNCTSMKGTFSSLVNIHTIEGIGSWDTSKVTDFSFLFGSDRYVEGLDLSNWDTSSATNMNYMFNGCYSLTNINYGSNFVKPNGCSITNMYGSGSSTACPANKPSWWS